MDESYLSHHGILGQKWGIRRYQNPDGTLTDAGRKRYDKAQRTAEKLGKKIVDEFKKPTPSDERLFTTMRRNNQLRKDTANYKKIEEFIRSLGQTPVSELEKNAYIKTAFSGSPYNAQTVHVYELEMPDGMIRCGTYYGK